MSKSLFHIHPKDSALLIKTLGIHSIIVNQTLSLEPVQDMQDSHCFSVRMSTYQEVQLLQFVQGFPVVPGVQMVREHQVEHVL